MKTMNKTAEKSSLSYASSALLGSATHAFLGRSDGVSPAPYDSLNTALHVGDDPTCVAKNRELIKKHFAVKDNNLVIINQVHGTKVLQIEDALPPEITEADALITRRTGITIAIQTADCVPILLFEPERKIIGALHAGWRGTLDNIAGKTIEAMVATCGATPSKIRAAIGPAIGSCCYEVSEDVIEQFSEQPEHVRKNRQLDLPEINKIQLQEAGLASSNIDSLNICTSCERDRFFSYRADGGNTGRQLSLIMIAELP
jgi:hypothetical protein